MEARKMVSLPAELAERVDDCRFAHRLKTEADAIRRLIQLSLEASQSRSGTSALTQNPKASEASG
jgi:metal-responsive CopG/Arc/MetJ family transcriptional regulator